ncbi:MAG: hypothetical protein GC184_09130 [Rhizobiales bacterium]|nr:hypothetical protein [Hyphomicrobiales bacterium]
MFDKFLNLLEGGKGGDVLGLDRKQAAAAALLVEAARLDRDFSDAERNAIKSIISSKFGLDAETAQNLVAMAEKDDKMVHDDVAFLDSIKKGFSAEEKSELLEMLWTLSLADKNLHHFEEYLIWHMTRELGLSRDVCEKARDAAKSKAA